MWFSPCVHNLLQLINHAVPFRNRERITFDHLVSMKKPNEKALLRILRDGEEKEISITVKPVSQGSNSPYSFVN